MISAWRAADHVNMECIHGSCPKKDGLTALTAWMDKEEQSIFVMPLYNGNLPSAFYLAGTHVSQAS